MLGHKFEYGISLLVHYSFHLHNLTDYYTQYLIILASIEGPRFQNTVRYTSTDTTCHTTVSVTDNFRTY